MILCRPAVAGIFGAIFGVLMLLPGSGDKVHDARPDPPGPHP
jgi:hypothetical protein